MSMSSNITPEKNMNEMNEYNPPTFGTLPLKSLLLSLYNNYKAAFGDFHYKVGVTTVDWLEQRYQSGDRFEKLSLENIVCYCPSRQVCLDVETALMNILAEQSRCANCFKDGDRACAFSHESKSMNVVYFTKVKDDLLRCQYCRNVFSLETIDAHMATESSHVFLNKLMSGAKQFGHETLMAGLSLDPLPYAHKAFGRELICEFCEFTAINSQILSAHRIRCKENPLPRFPCLNDPQCDMRFSDTFPQAIHKQYHEKDEAFAKRDLPFKCQFCGYTGGDKQTLKQHENICKANPMRNENKKFFCKACNKTFSRNAHVKGHLAAARNSSCAAKYTEMGWVV